MREQALLRSTNATGTHRLCSVCDRILPLSDMEDSNAKLDEAVCKLGIGCTRG